MAGSFGGSGSGSGSGDDDLVTGINVTPLVDVVLVLLVIFLMTAPVIYQSAIRVQLPQAQSGEAQPEASPLAFTITQEGTVLWNTQGNTEGNAQPVDWATLAQKVAEIMKKSPEQTAIISADQAVAHGVVVRLMDTLRQAGLNRFALNVESSAAPQR